MSTDTSSQLTPCAEWICRSNTVSCAPRRHEQDVHDDHCSMYRLLTRNTHPVMLSPEKAILLHGYKFETWKERMNYSAGFWNWQSYRHEIGVQHFWDTVYFFLVRLLCLFFKMVNCYSCTLFRSFKNVVIFKLKICFIAKI